MLEGAEEEEQEQEQEVGSGPGCGLVVSQNAVEADSHGGSWGVGGLGEGQVSDLVISSNLTRIWMGYPDNRVVAASCQFRLCRRAKNTKPLQPGAERVGKEWSGLVDDFRTFLALQVA